MKFYLVIFFKDGEEAVYPFPAVEQLNFFWNNIEEAEVTGVGIRQGGDPLSAQDSR